MLALNVCMTALGFAKASRQKKLVNSAVDVNQLLGQKSLTAASMLHRPFADCCSMCGLSSTVKLTKKQCDMLDRGV